MINAISLFTGAGGLATGFEKAGINIVVANEINKYASATYKINHPKTKLIVGNIEDKLDDIYKYSPQKLDLIIGGPPCQGFSVAGKMDPNDPRSKMVWEYLSAVKHLKPKAFVIENVKALYKLKKWKPIKMKIISDANKMGYSCIPILLNSKDYDTPQKRERVFFIGIKDHELTSNILKSEFEKMEKKPEPLKQVLQSLGIAGSKMNPINSTAKIIFATNPILRKSPYSGMLFNGAGRPINLDEYANTLPASMGGNKTPIIDDGALYENKENFVVDYHKKLKKGYKPISQSAPARLRRLTIKEAAAIQTFPKNYIFEGPMSSVYKQIGNAVPVNLATAVAKVVIKLLSDTSIYDSDPTTLKLF